MRLCPRRGRRRFCIEHIFIQFESIQAFKFCRERLEDVLVYVFCKKDGVARFHVKALREARRKLFGFCKAENNVADFSCDIRDPFFRDAIFPGHRNNNLRNIGTVYRFFEG